MTETAGEGGLHHMEASAVWSRFGNGPIRAFALCGMADTYRRSAKMTFLPELRSMNLLMGTMPR